MPGPEYSISREDDASDQDTQVVWDGLANYNTQFYSGEFRPLKLFVRDDQGRIVGGLLGESYWGWMHVNILWLDESIRRLGHGSRLLAMAEDEGRRRNCRYVFLDTAGFQARPFYERNGYTVFGTQEDYPLGYERYFMKKDL